MEQEQQKKTFGKKEWLQIAAAVIALLAYLVIASVYGTWPFKDTMTDQQSNTNNKDTDTSEQTFIKDQEIEGLVRQYADREILYLGNGYEETAEEINQILRDALQGKKDFSKIEEIEQMLENMEIVDAPHIRSVITARTKLCISEMIMENDPNKCDMAEEYPNPIDWKDRADDLTATSQTLPLFLQGYYYESQGMETRADYFYRQIINHRTALSDIFGDDYPINDELYLEIVSQADLRVSDTDLTYTNSEYGFSVELTADWQGYEVVEQDRNEAYAITRFYFLVPTESMSWRSMIKEGKASPISIAVHTNQQWEEMEQGDGQVSGYLGHNDNYVFTYSGWQDAPEDLENLDFKFRFIIKN